MIGFLVLLCFGFALRPSISARTRTAEPPTAAQDPFWARIFGGTQPAEIVVADSCLVMLQDFLHTDISLDEYVHGQFPGNRLKTIADPGFRAGLQTLAVRQYTSLADLTMSIEID